MDSLVAASRKRIRSFIVLSILSCAEARPVINPDCNLLGYYNGLFQREISTWTRDELEDLVRRTHSNNVPFLGSNPESGHDGDVLTALLQLDQGNNSIEKETINLFYSNLEVPRYPIDGSMWMPEHVCPLFMTEEFTMIPTDYGWVYSDLHNIRPVHPLIHESGRGTQYFGICPICDELFEDGSDTCVCGDFFQPPDFARGVVARIWLYMQLRYPDLYISKCHLDQLLGWHVLYPPTFEERFRNEVICSEWQGNRNPFVDFPSLAWTIRVHETDCPEDVWYGDGTTTNENILELDPTFTVDDMEEIPDYNLILPLDDAFGYGENEGDGLFESMEDTTNDDAAAQQCAKLLAGDIFFYVLQSAPTRIGLLPLIDLPAGLDLYMTTSLSFQVGSQDTPLIRLFLEEVVHNGIPFGFGRDLLMGDQWKILTLPLMLGGDNDGGDEVFLFCYSPKMQINLISAITTNGQFRDVDHPLLQNQFGSVILPSPMDYYAYDGPSFSEQLDYQWALKSSSNWIAIDFPGSTLDYSDALRAIQGQQNQSTSDSLKRQVVSSGGQVAIVFLACTLVLL